MGNEKAAVRWNVKVMADVQLNRQFNGKEQAQMVAFLTSLTGEQPQIVLPILPPSNQDTPRPQPF